MTTGNQPLWRNVILASGKKGVESTAQVLETATVRSQRPV